MATAGKKQFSGEYEHVLDDKSRVIVPISWRETLGEAITLCRSLDGTPCVWGFSQSEYDQFYAELESGVALADLEGQRQLRLLSRSVSEVEMDKQGRIPVPKKLRDHAVISNESKGAMVTIVGRRNHFEIWDPEKLEEDTAGIEPKDLLAKVDQFRQKAQNSV